MVAQKMEPVCKQCIKLIQGHKLSTKQYNCLQLIQCVQMKHALTPRGSAHQSLAAVQTSYVMISGHTIYPGTLLKRYMYASITGFIKQQILLMIEIAIQVTGICVLATGLQEGDILIKCRPLWLKTCYS